MGYDSEQKAQLRERRSQSPAQVRRMFPLPTRKGGAVMGLKLLALLGVVVAIFAGLVMGVTRSAQASAPTVINGLNVGYPQNGRHWWGNCLVLSSLIVVTKRISLYSQFMPLSPCFFYHHLTNAALGYPIIPLLVWIVLSNVL